jgi:formyltetrahydrofolate deformylase
MSDSAVLLIDCPDRKGLVARVSGLLYEHGANILHADQHQDHDLGLFFMRVEWALDRRGNGTGSRQLNKQRTKSSAAIEAASGNEEGGGIEAGGENKVGNGLVGESSIEAVESAGRPLRRASDAPGSTDQSAAVLFDLEAFKAAFVPMAAELGMSWQLTSRAQRPRVALFCSQYLHCMADLLHRWHTNELACEIPVIVSNHRAVERLAGFYGIPFEFIEVAPATKADAEERQLAVLAENKIDLVVLARYMQILSSQFVAHYPARIINVHHSFLPAFTGARPYHAAHARGVKLIGATSHYVTDLLDDGPIIEQDVARISHRDQVEDLVARGRDLERIVLSRAVRWHLDRRILCYGNKTVVFD